MSNKLEIILIWGIIILIVYLGIASTIFKFRHPWATDTEVFIHIDKVILLKKMSYQEMRPQ